MCILFIAVDVHPDYPLIVCANRDEFHHRPTAPAQFWPPQHRILAGKDLEAGGTWLGINTEGQFAGLTNIRAPEYHQEDMRSRGELVLKALEPKGIDHQWLLTHSDHYNPFNLVYQQDQSLYCYHSLSKTSQVLPPGCHAISNGRLDDVWPKMAKGTLALEQHLAQATVPDLMTLLAIMRDESQAEEERLPSTGVALEWERLLSAIYIKHPEYGTRSTSIVLRDRQGKTRFVEVRYDGKGRQLGQQEWTLPSV